MIGNDIVDMNYAKVHTNWKRQGYLNKIFQESERQLIMDSENPELVLWTLWSMKESVYKASLRDSKERRLNPKAFLCRLITSNMGTVMYRQKTYNTRSVHNDAYLHTQAFRQDLKKDLHVGLIKISKANLDSHMVHRSLIASVAKRKKWDLNSLKIKKDPLGIPTLYRHGIKTSMLCSMSHHGGYGAYLSMD